MVEPSGKHAGCVHGIYEYQARRGNALARAPECNCMHELSCGGAGYHGAREVVENFRDSINTWRTPRAGLRARRASSLECKHQDV